MGCYWVEEDLCSVCAEKIRKGVKAPTVKEIKQEIKKITKEMMKK
jgi:radical SAM superfamily enzyme with C-terminal helix-hairpin-helix motif